MNLEGKTVSSIPDAPLWNQELASDSEAIVKAERAPPEPMEQLQKETVDIIEEQEKVKEEIETELVVEDLERATEALRAGP